MHEIIADARGLHHRSELETLEGTMWLVVEAMNLLELCTPCLADGCLLQLVDDREHRLVGMQHQLSEVGLSM